ncbi:hypothetical protein [Spiroplasma sp. AdecLV25b]|uniref:hypothetical protein n=1 Tax=Spiroplasma sp. AdecLV25b TaxID=3027162 RepID=UPI0027DEE37A|nr:hypothetical protein [Spiroplasma sp. AdecLV25b]
MPKNLSKILIARTINADKIQNNLNELVECVYNFQNNFIAKHLAKKEYNEYLEFMNIDISPRYIIAPYFMIKDNEDFKTKIKWLAINNNSKIGSYYFFWIS